MIKIRKFNEEKSLSYNDVLTILYNQYWNKKQDKTKEELERWIISRKFYFVKDVPVNIIGISGEYKDTAYSDEPIIIEENVMQVGRYMGTFGSAPDILVIDGKHRLNTAIKQDKKYIDVYAGENVLDIINKEKEKLKSQKLEIVNLIITFFNVEVSGGVLRILKNKLPEYEINLIRQGRKDFKSGLLLSNELLQLYPKLKELL